MFLWMQSQLEVEVLQMLDRGKPCVLSVEEHGRCCLLLVGKEYAQPFSHCRYVFLSLGNDTSGRLPDQGEKLF